MKRKASDIYKGCHNDFHVTNDSNFVINSKRRKCFKSNENEASNFACILLTFYIDMYTINILICDYYFM